MSTVNKVLAGMFFLLLLVLSAEAVYLILGRSQQATPSKSLASEFANRTLLPESQVNRGNLSKDLFDQSVDASKDRYKLVENNILRSSLVSDEYAGVIESVGRIRGSFERGGYNFDYDAFLALSVGNDDSYTFYWNNTDLAKIVIAENRNGQETSLTLDNLKKGDKITMKAIAETLEDPIRNLRRVIIIRWSQ